MNVVFAQAYDAASALLPSRMDSPNARAELETIGLQESRFKHRKQVWGPAHGFWQFEKGGGVRAVLTHRASKDHIRVVLEALVYDDAEETSYVAIQHNDVLACAYARLLLWTLPDALPDRGEADEGWQQYISAWRPGKPHRATWDAFYERAWIETTKEG